MKEAVELKRVNYTLNFSDMIERVRYRGFSTDTDQKNPLLLIDKPSMDIAWVTEVNGHFNVNVKRNKKDVKRMFVRAITDEVSLGYTIPFEIELANHTFLQRDGRSDKDRRKIREYWIEKRSDDRLITGIDRNIKITPDKNLNVATYLTGDALAAWEDHIRREAESAEITASIAQLDVPRPARPNVTPKQQEISVEGTDVDDMPTPMDIDQPTSEIASAALETSPAELTMQNLDRHTQAISQQRSVTEYTPMDIDQESADEGEMVSDDGDYQSSSSDLDSVGDPLPFAVMQIREKLRDPNMSVEEIMGLKDTRDQILYERRQVRYASYDKEARRERLEEEARLGGHDFEEDDEDEELEEYNEGAYLDEDRETQMQRLYDEC